jgi:hypothetical protein
LHALLVYRHPVHNCPLQTKTSHRKLFSIASFYKSMWWASLL